MSWGMGRAKTKLSLEYITQGYFRRLSIGNYKLFKFRVSRGDRISLSHCGGVVYIHQGRTWVKLKLSKYHVGRKFGSFACTKKPFIFRPKKKKKR